jgi:hypothetical protein
MRVILDHDASVGEDHAESEIAMRRARVERQPVEGASKEEPWQPRQYRHDVRPEPED